MGSILPWLASDTPRIFVPSQHVPTTYRLIAAVLAAVLFTYGIFAARGRDIPLVWSVVTAVTALGLFGYAGFLILGLRMSLAEISNEVRVGTGLWLVLGGAAVGFVATIVLAVNRERRRRSFGRVR